MDMNILRALSERVNYIKDVFGYIPYEAFDDLNLSKNQLLYYLNMAGYVVLLTNNKIKIVSYIG